ncbi:MAG: haloacid dehalogenase type II [Gammaproteobacteria bacterium]|jgi:2-haloacid dehalogenase|nr:haloacid dehalogenase type II [Gammaproteobacteria bacterium]
MSDSFDNIKACVFDAYGTLFDVHSAVGRYRERVGDDAERLSNIWRDKQLSYTWLRSLMGRHADFWEVTGEALDYAMSSCRIDDPALRDDLLNAYLSLDAYPEVPAVLAALRNAGQRLAILSNGSPAMLEAAVQSSGIGDLLEEVLSVESVGIYKPDPRVYALASERLGVTAGEIAFQSSNAWDVAGASSAGLKVAWINRFGQVPETLPFRPHAELRDLGGLPALLQRNS